MQGVRVQGDAAEFKLEHLSMWCCRVQKREQWRRGGFGFVDSEYFYSQSFLGYSRLKITLQRAGGHLLS